MAGKKSGSCQGVSIRRLLLVLIIVFVPVLSSHSQSIRERAAEGDAIAQYDLGVMYAKGKGVAQDYVEARKWYLKAAEQGFAAARDNRRYFTVARELAAQYLAEAASGSNEVAQGGADTEFNRDALLEQGVKAYDDNDFQTAFRLLMPLAQEGVARAQHLIGQLYYSGHGVVHNNKAAASWWERAARQGLSAAQNDMGVLYHRHHIGSGVPQDFKKAAGYYHQAAKQGYGWAQLNIGGMWFNGEGVPQNFAQAAYWFAAAAKGNACGLGPEVVCPLNAKLTRKANKWVKRSKEVARKRQQNSVDDVTALLILAAIATAAVALTQTLDGSSEWSSGSGCGASCQHQRRQRKLMGDHNRNMQNWSRLLDIP